MIVGLVEVLLATRRRILPRGVIIREGGHDGSECGYPFGTTSSFATQPSNALFGAG